ncbi:TonB-dependent receptor [Stenotrophomonas maltophilia]|uniref:TonB-dependent receptor n=1 Tax=Stenotrophomonas maltophilia group TaxID=995085 RepID=UPI00070A39E5|nr:TonB-dependent receptor [Stenotrophomonas maltophilia]KRG51892.1 TonB-dependent receptor [Stenotrophomonas maltophilia]NNH48084.1 TonB-dependent receptor [Stenotrophomonas maltophilia]VEE51341.1 TonB-dependent receptor [Stenotrophomonas maltophilia]
MPSTASACHRRVTVLALAISTALLPLAWAPGVQAQPAVVAPLRQYTIPEQPLADAVRAFGRQADVQVVFRSDLVEGRRSSAVKGEYSQMQALQQLLRGSGVRAQRGMDGTWSLRAAAEAGEGEGVRLTETLDVAGRLQSEGGEARDRRGYDDVFALDLTTAYSGRDRVERYRGSNPADVVKDLVGVFSGDARNSGALDINIRGIQGPGRVPVSIDGGEQALTVWRGYNGVSNRNYIDPNLIGGIQVIKGPGLVRDVHSGIGGALVIKTIDVDDIVEAGERFGGELKIEGSSNAVAPRLPRLHTGEDYRTVPGFPQGSPNSPYDDRTLVVPVKSRSGNNPFDGEDQAWRLALGVRGNNVDLMAAYAWRKRGNYFSGSNGSAYYDQDRREQFEYQGIDYITTLARYFKPGDEVPNTSSEQESWLVKGSWQINDDQQLKVTWRRTLSHYGEIMPSRILSAPDYGRIQWPLSRVASDAWNLEYRFQPAGSRWLDLYANLWRTETDSDTYTAGGFPNFAPGNPVWNPDASPILRNTALANARNDRTGLTLSNRFALHSTLDLTVGGNWQYEKLGSRDPYFGITDGWRMFPRAGRRQEGEGYLSLEWRPVDFLTLNAGVRYSRYWAFDDFLQAHPELLTKGVGSKEATYRTNELPERPASLQAEIDALEAEREFWDSIGMGSVVDDALHGLLAYYETPQAVEHRLPWLPDANGNYARATNPCLNGRVAAIPGVLPVYPGSDLVCNIGNTMQSRPVDGRNGRRRDYAWLPTFSATVNLSKAARVYLRYSEAVRFPSMFESTIAFSSSLNPLYTLKPEHAYNYELGYVHNLSGLFGNTADADVKLAYYVHMTRNVIERDASFLFDNIDKQTIRGIELQARFDNRRFFTDLGISRILENEVCDESTAVLLDANRGLVPNCVQDGFVSGYLLTQAIPKLSVNLSLGTRLFDERLELGSRIVHYQRHENPDLQAYRDRLLAGGSSMLWQNVPFTWGNITTVDAYARWRFNEHASVELVGSNLGNRYYVDPATRSTLPAPGRTLKLGITARF